MINEDEQLRKRDKAKDKAVHEVEKERKGKQRDDNDEWFQWVAKVSKDLKKHILH